MQTLRTARLLLEPLLVGHAGVMFEVLSDPAIYRYLDYRPPPSTEHLQSLYMRLEQRRSPDGTQQWLNWVVLDSSGAPVGYVQATIEAEGSAWVGYVLSSPHWGRGYAAEAMQAMLDHLGAAYGVHRFFATVEEDNERSARLLGRLAFHPASGTELIGHSLSPTERLFVR
jgi:[ribosomal protein S5]-alanine N-acetyltransferase